MLLLSSKFVVPKGLCLTVNVNGCVQFYAFFSKKILLFFLFQHYVYVR